MFQFNNCKKKVLQLELTIEHQQKQMDELRSIVLSLVTEIDKLQKEIHTLTESKYGKSI
jgi:cell division protein FtsB